MTIEHLAGLLFLNLVVTAVCLRVSFEAWYAADCAKRNQELATDLERETESQKQTASNMTEILTQAGKGVVYRKRFRI